MKVALAQMDIKAGDPEGNLKTMERMIEQAKNARCDVVAFPEMCVGGYLVGDLWLDDDWCRWMMSFNDRIREVSSGICVIYGNICMLEDETFHSNERGGRERIVTEGGLRVRFNAAYCYHNQKPAERYTYDVLPSGVQPKTLLPNYRYFDDKRYFFSAFQWTYAYGFYPSMCQMVSPFIIQRYGKEYKIGVALCEDAWHGDYPINPVKLLAERSDLIIDISTSPWTYGKNQARDRVMKATLDWEADRGGRKLPPIAYVNAVGAQNNGKNILVLDGASTVYGRDGEPKILANDYYEEELLIFDSENIPDQTVQRTVHFKIARKREAIIRGIRHLSETTNIWTYIIGLSGGVDSAVDACLLVEAVGKDNVVAVNMPSNYNSEATKNAAKQIAEELGIKYLVMPIQGLVEHNSSILQCAFDEELSPLTMENIQAKIRGTSILSNIAGQMGAFFVCNGNKDEVALGYATLYGDWGGAIAPIGDLTKAEVYQMAEYLNEKHFEEHGRWLIPQELLPDSLYQFSRPGDIRPSAELKNDQVDPIKIGYHCSLIEQFLDYRIKSPTDIVRWWREGTLAQKLGINAELLGIYGLHDAKTFLKDLKWLCEKMRIAVFKRVQSVPIIVLSKTAYGFDRRESILPRFQWTSGTMEEIKKTGVKLHEV